MLKYIKEYASSIEGINIYPIFSLLVFFIFFVVLLYYVKNMDKNKIEEISNLPLDPDTKDNDLFTTNNLKQA
jgi:cytochrome c oxidase cbb3-type subunit IV